MWDTEMGGIARQHKFADQFCCGSFGRSSILVAEKFRMSPGSKRENALLDIVYAAAANPALWPEALTRVSDHIGAIGGMVVYNAPAGHRSLQVLGRLSEELSAIYRQYYVWNPWTLAMKGVPFGRPVIANSLVENGAIRRTAFYADVLKPAGIEDMLCVSHKALACDGGVGGIGFSLSQRGAEQMAQGARRFSRLASHLTRALDTSLQLGRFADGTRHLARVLQLMPVPALLLDGKGRIGYANPTAETLLRTGDGLSVKRDGGLHLAAAMPAEMAALSHALAQALSVAEGTGDSLGVPLRLTRPSGRAPLLVLPVPLPPPAFALWELVESARAMVLIIDPEAPANASAETARTVFGLTAAEARVAALVGGGLNGPQVATVLGVSTQTVKTHLARCFAKTGVHSQAGLVRLLATLPAEVPSPSGGQVTDSWGR
jgi:DNA-binding CsgD family transcriptional regulator